MKLDFDELCEHLATKGGGYALWIGAGASIALSNGAAPTWDGLSKAIRADHALPARTTEDMPADLEEISAKIGHAAFRKELRKRIVDSLDVPTFNQEVLTSQAIIGARAAAVVSFNIEPITAVPFIAGKGGTSYVWRTFREPSRFGVDPAVTTGPGTVAPLVYFPHGILWEGNVVMTRSEYTKHQGSVAVATAVHLALGGDLVILGMSLGDSYLREALLLNRRWIRNIYWLGKNPDHDEWRRVADITFVPVDYARMWTGLSEAFIRAEKAAGGDKLEQIRQHFAIVLRPHLAAGFDDVRKRFPTNLDRHAAQMVALSHLGPTEITAFADYCIATGHDVPAVLASDPRCRI